MPSSRVQRKQSIIQNTDNNNGGGMKKQGGPVTTGNTHTYWKPTLTRTIIRGIATNNYKATYDNNPYRPFNLFGFGTGTRYKYP
jgi:hypothetical protein